MAKKLLLEVELLNYGKEEKFEIYEDFLKIFTRIYEFKNVYIFDAYDDESIFKDIFSLKTSSLIKDNLIKFSGDNRSYEFDLKEFLLFAAKKVIEENMDMYLIVYNFLMTKEAFFPFDTSVKFFMDDILIFKENSITSLEDNFEKSYDENSKFELMTKFIDLSSIVGRILKVKHKNETYLYAVDKITPQRKRISFVRYYEDIQTIKNREALLEEWL